MSNATCGRAQGRHRARVTRGRCRFVDGSRMTCRQKHEIHRRGINPNRRLHSLHWSQFAEPGSPSFHWSSAHAYTQFCASARCPVDHERCCHSGLENSSFGTLKLRPTIALVDCVVLAFEVPTGPVGSVVVSPVVFGVRNCGCNVPPANIRRLFFFGRVGAACSTIPHLFATFGYTDIVDSPSAEDVNFAARLGISKGDSQI